MFESTEVRIIKNFIRTSCTLPIRDFIEFCYKEHFNETDPALRGLVVCHHNLFMSTLSENIEDVSRNNELLFRISNRHGLSPEILADLNMRILFELIKIIASQNRNSPTAIAKHCIVISMIAHSLWSAADQVSAQTQEFFFQNAVTDQLKSAHA